MGGRAVSAPVGSLATEAVQLLDVLAERLGAIRDRQRAGDADRAADRAGDADRAADRAGDADRAADHAGDADRAADHAGDADRADRTGDGVPGPTPAGREGASAGRCPHCGHDPAAAVSCTACPWCAGLALLRGERPEAAAKLADGALALVQALRAVLAQSGTGHPGAAHQQGGEPGSPPTRHDDPGADAPAGTRAPGGHGGGLLRIDVS